MLILSTVTFGAYRDVRYGQSDLVDHRSGGDYERHAVETALILPQLPRYSVCP